MSGYIRSAPGKKIIPTFVCGSDQAFRVRTCGSGHITGIFVASVLACVVFVDSPTMGGAESTTVSIVANGSLQLAGATFGFSWRNRGGGVSGGGSGI